MTNPNGQIRLVVEVITETGNRLLKTVDKTGYIQSTIEPEDRFYIYVGECKGFEVHDG